METRIVLVGIGGYGDLYVRALLNEKAREGCLIAGVVDPFAEKAPGYEALKALDVPFYDTLDEFYAADKADLAVIATPIPLHESQAVKALESGSHVLLEKPIAATPEAGEHIRRAAAESGKKLAIGFQWCYDAAMLKLKADFDSGLLGRPLDLRSLVLWPRDRAYYSRGTGWAGKKYSKYGEPIFDSIASNATAHYLENMLWLTGEGYSGARLADFEVETWKANAIETYDTITLRARLDNGANITFAASHAIRPEALQEPMFVYKFENATAYFGGFGIKGEELTARFTGGAVKDYGVSNNGSLGYTAKLWTVIDAIRDKAPIPCPAEAALAHADAIYKMRQAQPDARVFDDIADTGDRVFVPGLEEKLRKCFESSLLLSQAL